MGPLSNKAELKAYRDMLATVSQRIGKLVADGKSVEEIAASRPRPTSTKMGQGIHQARPVRADGGPQHPQEPLTGRPTTA
jgi:hypothetical protein